LATPTSKGLEPGDGDLTSEPAETEDEHELELRDNRACDAQEQIVRTTVCEVILDSSTADPADTAVHRPRRGVPRGEGRSDGMREPVGWARPAHECFQQSRQEGRKRLGLS
jgi:hypothetical protein